MGECCSRRESGSQLYSDSSSSQIVICSGELKPASESMRCPACSSSLMNYCVNQAEIHSPLVPSELGLAFPKEARARRSTGCSSGLSKPVRAPRVATACSATLIVARISSPVVLLFPFLLHPEILAL